MPGPAFLYGETVTLRPVEREDLPFLQTTINDPDVWSSLAANAPINMNNEEGWFESVGDGDDVHLLITDGDRRVGMISLTSLDPTFGSAELGYWIAPDEQRQGYATDAVRTITAYGFDHRRLHRIVAHVFAFNDASRTLLENVGFREEGVLRESAYVDGSYCDMYCYGVLEDELERTH